MKSKHIYLIIAILSLVFLSLTAFTSKVAVEPEKSNKSIIKFSHSLHAEVTDCASCHSSVSDAKTLDARLIPGKEDCAACHDVEDDENCNMCHYEDVYEPLVQKQADLFFDHSFHVGDQEMECTTCHKGLAEVDYGFESTGTNPPMETCFTCHNESAAATYECEACHTSTANLIPESHQTVSFSKSHKFDAMDADENCVMCHTNDFCESCHVGTTMLTEGNTATDFYVPYSPHRYTDNAKQQQLTRVHDLNYRFTHGIEAKSKTMECSTCHQTETFCAECHNGANEDFAQSGIVPTSHTMPNFVMIGVGSGGGAHADLAKRDIERCASCHDTFGGDPTCMLCHTDNDGIKGTNPKTHDINFMQNENGDWHESDGAVCYNCHTSASATTGIAGVGFCGYCHGAAN